MNYRYYKTHRGNIFRSSEDSDGYLYETRAKGTWHYSFVNSSPISSWEEIPYSEVMLELL